MGVRKLQKSQNIIKIDTKRVEIARHELILHKNEAEGSRMPVEASADRFDPKMGPKKIKMSETRKIAREIPYVGGQFQGQEPPGPGPVASRETGG